MKSTKSKLASKTSALSNQKASRLEILIHFTTEEPCLLHFKKSQKVTSFMLSAKLLCLDLEIELKILNDYSSNLS
jgi:hypothetical protein